MRADGLCHVRGQRGSSHPRGGASSIPRVPDPTVSDGRSVRERRDLGRSVHRVCPLLSAAVDPGSPPTTERLRPTRCSCACWDPDPRRSSGRDLVVADVDRSAHRQGRRSPSTRRPWTHRAGCRSCRVTSPPCWRDCGAAVVLRVGCPPPRPRASIARPPPCPARAWCPRRHVPGRAHVAHPSRVDEAGRTAANTPPGSPGSGRCRPPARRGGSAWPDSDART